MTSNVLSILAAATGAAENLSVFDPASPPAAEIRSLFLLVLAITGAIFLAVEGMILYCIFRFRQREASPTREPPQIYGSKPIEVAWTLAPALVVFVLFLIVVRTEAVVRRDEAPPGALRVTVVGHQWWWEYRYPELGVVTANELHIPAGRPIYFDLQSVDVIHSFWVPRLAGKTDVIPGRTNHMWFEAQEPGLYLGQCAEYCGTQHANMMIRVVAETPEEFGRWVKGQQEPAAAVPAASADRAAFFRLACVNCHTIRGTDARGTFGPDLTHLMSRQTLATGVVPNDHESLLQWVKDPQTIKPGCLMPDFQLSPEELRRVVAYLETLR